MALTDNDLSVPLFGETNLAGGNHFDQIAFTSDGIKTNLFRHDSFDWRCAVFKPDKKEYYKDIAIEMRGGKPYKKWDDKTYRDWTTFEMSDHLPVWVELKVDYSDKYLKDHFT